MSAQCQTPEPPQPPPFERRIQIPRLQLIGVPLLLILPLLAAFRVFGDTTATARAANDALALQVEYPARYRYKMNAPLNVEVTYLAGTEPVTVTVEFSRPYMDRFSSVSFLPDVAEITPDAYRVEAPNLAAGETRTVAVEIQAEQYWRHRGQVTASLEGESPVSVPLQTWVFP